MHTQIWHDIKEVSPELWDSTLHTDDWLHSHRFLKCIQHSEINEARYRFLGFYEGTQLIGTSVISIFKIDLSLFAGNVSLVNGIKRFFPNVFKKSICFCGIPLSAGQNNVRVIHEDYLQEVTRLTDRAMKDLCKEAGVNISIFKEFTHTPLPEEFIKLGYIAAPSLPGLILQTDFTSFAEYLSSIRAPYRRQIRTGLQKLNAKEPVFAERYFDGRMDEEFPVFTIIKPDELEAHAFYQMYLSVMERAETKLELLSETFFRNAFDAFSDELKLLCMVFKGQLLGVFIFRLEGKKMTFLWTGKPENKDAFQTYPNLLIALIYHAIEMKCTWIDMGQTSYYPKMRLGSEPFDLQFFIRSDSIILHSLIRNFKKFLFPEQRIQALHVSKILVTESMEAS